ncbi:hypothetical protein BDZ89DRAFT_1145975 [Hymenopellis radicata]|nr:hypothetical protein BDZ89DRAFT_1145975 [Hymenopellis radicata]
MQSDESAIPADVYYNILRRIKDLTFLWTTCRAVSRDFRDAVDLVFIRHHLPKTYLAADMGLSASFSFDSLDPSDPAIALFKDKDCDADLRPKVIRRLKDRFDDEFGNVCHAPRIVVQVRRLANDTPICDMKPDWDTLSLTANWKKMFSEFFAEEKAYHRSMQAQLDAAKDTIVAMRDDPDFGATMEFLFATYERHDETARRQVRDRRIKRHVWEQSHIDWKRTDSKGLKNVAEERKALGWLEFSDEEEESEEEARHSEEEDEDSEDEDEDRGGRRFRR